MDTIKTRYVLLSTSCYQYPLILFCAKTGANWVCVVMHRMQSIEARREYRNSLVCAARIFKDEGILTFWSGALPRLARLVLSGGIVFTMSVFRLSYFQVIRSWRWCGPARKTDLSYRYENTMDGLDRLDPKRQYIWACSIDSTLFISIHTWMYSYRVGYPKSGDDLEIQRTIRRAQIWMTYQVMWQ